MSIRARAYIVREVVPGLQIHWATIDIGVLPLKIDGLFRDLEKKDAVDFYPSPSERSHITRRHRDSYGNPLRVACLDDIIDTVRDFKKDDWLNNGRLFRDMLISLKKNYGLCKFLIFIEEN